MFPHINQIYRPKEQNSIPPLKLLPEKVTLIQEAGIHRGQFHNIKNNGKTRHYRHPLFQNTYTKRSHGPRTIKQNYHRRNKLKNKIKQDITLNKTICTFSNENTSDNPKQPDPEINYFTNYNQLSIIFSTLNNKKSSDFDGIPNISVKRLPNKIKWYYTVLFNNALNNTYFPRKWKKAKLIAITKKDKDGSSPANLRPISLLPNISKVYEMVINNPLAAFCSKNKVIPENQFCFQHKHSTIHAINKLTSDICWALNEKQRVAACLIDLEKALDTVCIPGVIYKTIKKNFPEYLIKVVWDMITNCRDVCVALCCRR